VAKGRRKAKDSHTERPCTPRFNWARKIRALLIEKGVDVNGTDKTGQTPDLAMQRNSRRSGPAPQKGREAGHQRLSLWRLRWPATREDLRAPGAPAARPEPLEVDPNAIRAELKAFEGLAEALKAVDNKADVEVQSWALRGRTIACCS
jgi:hypothetical protein